jgi:hypothetical protein
MRGRERVYVSAGRAEQGVVGAWGRGNLGRGAALYPLWSRTCNFENVQEEDKQKQHCGPIGNCARSQWERRF